MVDQLKIFSGVQFDPEIVSVVLDTMLFDIFSALNVTDTDAIYY
ncbi:hypothetical protein [Desulfoscipio gibsoniae]|nr:hypothetical protein [Desulfoscipio gibsoniae]